LVRLLSSYDEDMLVEFIIDDTDSSDLYKRLIEISNKFSGFSDMQERVTEIIGRTGDLCIKERVRDDLVDMYLDSFEYTYFVELIGDMYEHERNNFEYLRETYHDSKKFETAFSKYLSS